MIDTMVLPIIHTKAEPPRMTHAYVTQWVVPLSLMHRKEAKMVVNELELAVGEFLGVKFFNRVARVLGGCLKKSPCVKRSKSLEWTSQEKVLRILMALGNIADYCTAFTPHVISGAKLESSLLFYLVYAYIHLTDPASYLALQSIFAAMFKRDRDGTTRALRLIPLDKLKKICHRTFTANESEITNLISTFSPDNDNGAGESKA